MMPTPSGVGTRGRASPMELARHTAVGIHGKGFTLDGVVTSPLEAGRRHPAVLVCHPHPLLGGDMDNAVVVSICQALAGAGIASVRFNFRRAGEAAELERSAVEDVAAAFDMLRASDGVDGGKVGVAGYSFGASAILNALPRIKRARAFVFVAPSVRSVEQAAPALKGDGRPKLFLVGGQDRLVPAEKLQQLAKPLPSAAVQVVEGADHGWHGREQEAAHLAAEFLARSLGHAGR